MSILFDNPPPAIGCGDPGDPIDFGCLFEGGFLYKDFADASADPAVFTASGWIKRHGLTASKLSGIYNILDADPRETDGTFLAFDASTHQFFVGHYVAGAYVWGKKTSGVFRGPAGWFHFHVVVNTHALVAEDRVKVRIDGVRSTLSGTSPVVDSSTYMGTETVHTIGASDAQSINTVDSSIAALFLFPGVERDVSEFGYFNAYGHFVPKNYAGAYSTNGFHLDFADPLNLGKDVSGNGNHFAAVGLTSDNQVTDTPTKNIATINASAPGVSSGALSSGNTRMQTAYDGVAISSKGTISARSGRFFHEVEAISNGGYGQSGIGITWSGGNFVRFAGTGGNYSAYGTYGVAVDLDAGAGWIRSPAGSWIGGGDPTEGTSPTFTFNPVGLCQPYCGVTRTTNNPTVGVAGYNFNPDEFDTSPPEGFAAWRSVDMPCPDILNPDDYFTTRQSIGGAGITNLPWNPTVHKTLCLSKSRDSETDWRASDTVRGDNLAWESNVGGLEAACSLSFTSSGIAPGADAEYQGSRIDYFWRASPKSGFDIVEFTHVNGTPTTVSHAAGGVIEFALVVPLDGGDIRIYHHEKPDDYAILNSTGYGTDAGWLGTTAVNITHAATRPSGRYVAYVWRGVPQFSSFSAYPGNGLADGSFAPTDFLPRCIFLRRSTSGVSSRTVLDDLDRYEGNPSGSSLYMDGVEIEGTGSNPVDLVSNGAKLRVAGTVVNQSGVDHLFGAWAKTPGKFARAR